MTSLPAYGRCVDADDLPLDTFALARFLIGKVLVHRTPAGEVAGRIVETEAYPPGDAACHAFNGETRRNSSLFLRRGHFYVYRIYGRSLLLNLSSEEEGIGAGVLLRAIAPLAGLELMREDRPHLADDMLGRGPGRLADALRITADIDRQLVGGDLKLFDDGYSVTIGQSIRIGITKNAEQPWRFFAIGSPSVSGPKRLLLAAVQPLAS